MFSERLNCQKFEKNSWSFYDCSTFLCIKYSQSINRGWVQN